LEGEDGLVVSIVIDRGDEAELTFSAGSIAFAVIECTPSARSGSSTLQKVPVEPIVWVAISTPASKICIFDPGSAVPVIIGRVIEVVLSLDCANVFPVSLSEVMSRELGADAGVASRTITRTPEETLSFPKESSDFAVIE
jgi:hypothetical protein